MRHNSENLRFRFSVEPVSFNKFSEKEFLQYCLGGTLYMPSTRLFAKKIIHREMPEVKSMVLCFEDAIAESDLPVGEANVIAELNAIYDSIGSGSFSFDMLPLIFLRVRDLAQFQRFAQNLSPEHIAILTGFVFPKFYSQIAEDYFRVFRLLKEKYDTPFYVMPILEGPQIAHIETRTDELGFLKEILDAHRDDVLNVRIGGTDFSSLFGLRRSIDTSIYDIPHISGIISDIMNFFSRSDDGYTISAPVWEYFLADGKGEILIDPKKSVSHSILSRNVILNEAIDGLLREIIIDKVTGMVGKTVIHPSHLSFVNALQAITLEEFRDAEQVLNSNGGVMKSVSNNKMNEVNPHRAWARRIRFRAKAYGVIANDVDYLKLFGVG